MTQVAAAILMTATLVVLTYRFSAAEGRAQEAVVAAPRPPGVVAFAPNAPQLSSIVVQTAHMETMPVSSPQSGRIAYDENHTTRISSPIAGRVLALHAEVGDSVKTGQALAELDSPELGTAEADWQKARADELRKQRALDRAETLFDGQVLARKDLEGAQADADQARSETRRAVLRMRNLNAANTQNGVFHLKAGLTGIIAERQINPGQEVRPDMTAPLFVITALETLWVLVDVPEQMAALLHAGQGAVVESDAWPGVRFSAKVDRVGILLDPGTRRIQVRCAVPNPQRKLKPEMFAKVSFLPDGAAVQAVALPNTSLFVEGRYNFVFVQTKPGTFEKRRVTLRRSEGDRSFIDTGLADGEQVVTEGAFLLTTEVGGDAR
ncbi:MAG: efflux RND transporter periplasmic adaptor subunit [Herminiimonas sp.]|nr:efflux RND transporter periplasmic adaptor subunit [Herminiimonas sp.]